MGSIIRQLINQMTLEEKAALCTGVDPWHTYPVKRLKINSLSLSDGPHGLRKQAGEQIGQIGEGTSIPATCFPTASAMASSWNDELIYRIGQAVGEESRQHDVDILLAPGVNIKRSPLCGRNFEYYSEDPYLTSRIGSAFVRGVQSRGVGVCLKHFALSNQETRRMLMDTIVDERALREIYLYAFEYIVKHDMPYSLMSSYNKVNGTYASENRHLLTEILREEWGYEGVVISDWGAVNDIVASIQAGLNLEMPSNGGVSTELIIEAVKEGNLSETVLDESVADMLSLLFRCNIQKTSHYLFDNYANTMLAQEAAEECAVLLKNQDRILPLEAERETAVIGLFAKEPRIQGAGSSMVNPTEISIPWEEMQHMSDKLQFAQGYRFYSSEADPSLEEEALELARQTDRVVVFAGLPDMQESEGFDRTHLDIPKNQNHLISRIAKINPNVIVVLTNGAPVTMPWINEVKGVLEAHLNGQMGGTAIAKILFGEVNPSGKLAETFPLNLQDTPSYKYFPGEHSSVVLRESIYVGYRYYQKAHKAVLFPFGYGLSYTQFRYEAIRVSHQELETDGECTITFRLTNTGDFPGKEIVQLYVQDCNPRIMKPMTELKDYQKVFLNPGESKEVSFTFHAEALRFYDIQTSSWNAYESDFMLFVGTSSEDFRLSAKIHLNANQDFKAPHLYQNIISYHRFDKKIFTIPDMEYEVLYGKPIPFYPEKTVGSFDLESTLFDVKGTFVGGILYRRSKKQARERTEAEHQKIREDLPPDTKQKKDETPADRITASFVDDTPLKNLVLFGDGNMDFSMLCGILMMINKEKDGWKIYRQAAKRRKKINRSKRR